MAPIPATLMYRGYRYSTCTSINHVVCHGMPGDRALKEGDIVNIDVTFIVEGWYGNSSRMYAIGPIARKAERLIEVTYEAMMRGIAAVKPGATTGDIGHAIQSFVEPQGMSVVRDFCGHGLGRMFHDEPNIIHIGRPGEGVALKPGMFFTIEPMINLGKPHVKILSDGWTAVTRDRSLSAQFEHSVGVTATGVEIFTLSERHGEKQPPAEPVRTLESRDGQPGYRHGLNPADPALPGCKTRLAAACWRRWPRRPRQPDDRTRRDAALSRPSRAAARALSQRRARCAERLRIAGAGAVSRRMPRRDIKPLAKIAAQDIRLVRRSHSCAAKRACAKIEGIGDASITQLKLIAAAATASPRASSAAHAAVVME